MRNNKELGREKTSRIPIKIVPIEPLKKPSWIKMKLPKTAEYMRVKNLLNEQELHSVCEEASCPNIAECYSHGTATFMILGDLCTRRCPFCDVTHGKPNPPDDLEPLHLAKTISSLKLKYVVITSVDRDDLRDGGASHFVKCIDQIRRLNPNIGIEILVPDFRSSLNYYGNPNEEKIIRDQFKNFIVDEDKMAKTNKALFSHCLPLRRNIKATDGVMDSDYCVAIQEAGNRMHVQKSLLSKLLNKG